MTPLSRSEQLKFLANDVTLLETLFGNRDGELLTIPGKYMPDGEPYSISLEGVKEMTGELRKQMVDTVRSQWRARDENQNAEKAGPERAPAAADRRADSQAGKSGGTRVAAPSIASNDEESLDSLLQARKGQLEEALERALFEYTSAKSHVESLQAQLEDINKCINALQTESPEASTTSNPSGDSQRQEPLPPKSGSTKPSHKDSTKKT